MSEEREGGVAWEAREALKLVRVAREMGNSDDEYLGWLRYAEAVTNASYSGAASAFIGILSQRETDLAALLTKLGGERKAESEAVLAAIVEIKTGQTDAGQHDAELREHITLFQAEFHALTGSFVDVAERLTLLESSSKRKETQLADLRQQIVELRERTVADDLDADERREMIRTVRWLQTNMAEIAAALGLTPLERAA